MALDTGEKETDSYALSSLDSFNASDDHVVQNDISELEEKIMSIDLNVSSVQRALEGIYKEKADPHIRHKLSYKSSFFRTMVESVTSRPSKNQLATLDTEITERQGDLERLLSDRQRLKADLVSRKVELARRTCMQSSMGQLPVELWAQIFLLCLPNEDFITPDSRQAPLLLCQICSAWRNVATGTPLLWSALSIRGSWRRHIWKSSLERWLKRSGNAFLYLDISIPAYMEPTFDYHIFKVIISSADRWHHLRLNLTNQLLRSMLNNHMPVLQTLEFSSTYPIASLNVQPSHVPNLKTVSLLTKALYIQSLSLPWNQLTHLSSRCWLNIGQHVDILCKCPNLQSYSMCLVHAEMIPSSLPQTVLSHHLQVLEVNAFIGSAMGPVLSRLRLPNLTELTFGVPCESPAYGVTSWPKAHVVSLIERSSCSLTKLRLKGIGMSDEDLLDAKKSLPSPVSVELHNPYPVYFLGIFGQ